MCCHHMNRREFMGISAFAAAGAALVSAEPTAAAPAIEWDPAKPYHRFGRPLRVRPVLMQELYEKRPMTSWRPWGGFHSEADFDNEAQRIKSELAAMQRTSDFPLQVLSLERIEKKEQAASLRDANDYDVMLVYAAVGDGHVLESCYKPEKNNLMFIRHRSGPVYLWYETAHCRFLRKGGAEFEVDQYRNPSGMDVHDIIVDDYNELAVKLRAIHAKENFIGKRIVTLGGPGGWCCAKAPQVGQDKFGLQYITIGYQELGNRIKTVRQNSKRVKQAESWAKAYLSVKDTRLETNQPFVANAFLLYSIFREIMEKHQADAFTINDCMSAIMPMAETTACLTLSLLNDDGYMAFCESDFNVIPSGILLYHAAGKPVFLNDPTYPHHNMVTCAHCTAPRRMDGVQLAPARIMTHYESDYGATPKVELAKGTTITMICPDAGQTEYVGFTGKIIDSPFYDICRSQYDIEINGNWKKLLQDMKGFHWNMVVGDYGTEMEYACRKLGIRWNNVSAV
jgi:hypothetical protein